MKSRGGEKVSHYKSVIDYNFDQFTSQINGVWLGKKGFCNSSAKFIAIVCSFVIVLNIEFRIYQ